MSMRAVSSLNCLKTVLISILLPILDELLYNRVVSLWCVYFAVMIIIVVDELDYLYRCLAMLNYIVVFVIELALSSTDHES